MERCNKKYRRKLIGEWKEEWKKKEDKRIEKKVYTRAKNTKLDWFASRLINGNGMQIKSIVQSFEF